MGPKTFFTSKEAKRILSLSDCALMHEREKGSLKYSKKGNSFLYEINDLDLVIKHPIAEQIINWYINKHDVEINNFPAEQSTVYEIASLLKNILIPINDKFGAVIITYGFISAPLNSFIQRNSKAGTCPSLDQHSGHELNTKGARICPRGGVSCDFIVSGHESDMNIIAEYIVNNLEYDKIYYYAKNRPLHVSVSNEMQKHLQVMSLSTNGRRIPGVKAFGEDATRLVKELF
jgi:hypothetical protein